jgi:GDPmannose 4,6-dehydratase
MEKTVRFYQASTSELYGLVQERPQRETTPFRPRSPYAAAKLYAYWITVNYREAYGIFASNGILFNHEGPTAARPSSRARSPARSPPSISVSRRSSISAISTPARLGPCARLRRGHVADPAARRADDFVLATGETHTVREFVERAFAETGRRIEWRGKEIEEKGLDARTGEVLVEIDPRYFRPTEVEFLLGDPAKAQTALGWRHTTSFPDLVKDMIRSDLDVVRREHEAMGRRGEG